MSHSCFCINNSCLKSLFHLKYSSERRNYLAASLSLVQPGYTTRFAFKEGLTMCPTPAVGLAGLRLTGVHYALGIAPELHLMMRQFPLTNPRIPHSLPTTWAFFMWTACQLARCTESSDWISDLWGCRVSGVRKKKPSNYILFSFQANVSPREAVEPHPETLDLIDLWHVNFQSSSFPTLKHLADLTEGDPHSKHSCLLPSAPHKWQPTKSYEFP